MKKSIIAMITMIYACASYAFMSYYNLYQLGLVGAENRLLFFTILYMIMVVLFLFVNKSKIYVIIGLVLATYLTLGISLLDFFTIHNIVNINVLFSFFFEFIVILFCMNNIKDSISKL